MISNIECSSEKFWDCDRNKENLQFLSRSFLRKTLPKIANALTLSDIIGNSGACNGIQCIQYRDGITSNKENSGKPIERADLRLIPHIEDSIQSKKHTPFYFQIMQTFWCKCCILCNISLLLVWKNYGYNWQPGKLKDLYFPINYHINQAPICVQIYSKHISERVQTLRVK